LVFKKERVDDKEFSSRIKSLFQTFSPEFSKEKFEPNFLAERIKKGSMV